MKSDFEPLDGILPESKCAIRQEDIAFLKKKIFGDKKFVTSLLFRGTKNGFKFVNFHSCCDKKGKTITLFKLKDGNICIGGYTRE